MIIKSTKDIKTWVDNGHIETHNEWEKVLDKVVGMIWFDRNSPAIGEDWEEYLNSIDLIDLISRVDDGLTAGR